MTKAAKPKAKASTVEIFDFEQNSPEWFEARLGIVTASNFHKVMAGGEGKVRAQYMRDLAGEILTGRPAEAFVSEAMRRGKQFEPEAIEHYARSTFEEVRRVGFVRNAGLMKYAVAGASPDALVGEDGGLETKTTTPAALIEMLEKDASLPTEHRAQVHGCMWVCERKWWDIKVYYPGMPDYTVHVERDDFYIKQISDAVEVFCYDLKKLVEKLRAMGGNR